MCDIGQMLFWGKTWAWYATAVMFVLNNTFIQVIQSRISTFSSSNIFRVFTCLSVPNTSTQSQTTANAPLHSQLLPPSSAGSVLSQELSPHWQNSQPYQHSSHSSPSCSPPSSLESKITQRIITQTQTT